MSNNKMAWHVAAWALIGVFALRPMIQDDLEFMLACAMYALLLGFTVAVIDMVFGDDNE